MPWIEPYLIRAVRDWAMDSGLTPQILVDARVAGVRVPDAYVQNGRITLNIHDRAVGWIELGNERLRFSTRFGGQPFDVEVPVEAVVAVFAQENGRGFVFKDPESPDRKAPPAAEQGRRRRRGGPSLRLVK